MSRKSAAVSVVSLVVILALMPFGGLASGAGRQPCPNFFWQNPLPQGSNLHDVGAADANTAWAVGDGYTVIKTTDGGRNWTPQDLGFYSEKPEEKATAVTSVSVVNRDVVWICCETTGQTGSVSYIFRTLDGGENWERFTSPAGLSSTGISAISADVAWVACEDNMVFRTTDGGKNWDWYLVPFIGRCSNISALDGNNAWVIGAGNGVRAAVTHDGGQTWDQQQIEKSALGAFDIQAVSNHVAYVSVWNKFKTIDDSGGDWKITTRSLGDINTWLGALSFSDPLNGWIIGENYDANDFFIAKTADSGENWSFLHYPQTYPGQRLLGISALDSNTVWAAGHEGLLIKTDDAGGQWSKFDSDLLGWPSDPTCIESTNEKTAYIAGAGGRIWRTGNGGISWELLQTGVSKDLCALDVLDSRVIWAVGNEGTILKTVDGGRNWSKQASGVSERLLHVSAVSIDVAWASGEDCRLLRTDDGGATWRIVDVGLPPQELCIEALDSNIAWCGAGPGDNLSPSGTVLKTVDGGKSWETQSLPNPRPGFLFNRTFAISIVNGDLAYALAEIVTPEQTDSFGVVFKTTDGGKKWTWMHDDVLDRAYVTLDGMDVAGENIISVCGRFGLFYKSTDGGTSWTYEMTGMGGNLRGVSAIGGQAEWLVGDGGAILRSTTPFVYSVSPDVALNTGTVKITDLEGNGFWDGMDVKLVKSEKEILASNVQVLSPYKATCEFDLEGAEAGAYDVLVFNTNGRSGSLAHGFHVTDAKTWYLPEGSTAKSRDGGFETWVLIENPNRESAKVKVTYMTPGGAVKGPDVTVPPNSRMTIDVSQTVPDNWSVSTRIDADRSVVAEHAMYWDTDTTFRQAAGGSIGLTHTSKEWFLAEGS
ncbi:MAG: hypothetical protein KJ625_03030, partial [Actinobacteria bacterium]|nr:hypothetical protein [Actinomycetota bacterium]